MGFFYLFNFHNTEELQQYSCVKNFEKCTWCFLGVFYTALKYARLQRDFPYSTQVCQAAERLGP